MKKKILISTAVFTVIFIISIWTMIPYENLIKLSLTKIERSTKYNISYTSLSSGPLSTQIDNFEINNIPLGVIKAGHGPFNLISQKIDIDIKGPVTGEAVLSESKSSFDVSISSALINSFVEKAEFEGDIRAKGKGSPAKEEAEAVISLDKVTVDSELGPLSFEKINTELSVSGNTLTIKKLTSEDDFAMNLTGTVRINQKNFAQSLVNISGSINVFGEKKELLIKGRFSSLQPSIR